MPGDGSCLYHSINHGVRALRGTAPSAATLRRKLAAWARDNSQRKVSGKTMRTWLNWETGGRITLNEYVTRQAKSGWGGVIELIAAAWECEVEVARPTLNSSARHHLNRMAAPSTEPSMCVALAAYDYEYTHEQTFEITTKVVRSMPSTPMRE